VSVTAKPLINAKYAAAAGASEYVVVPTIKAAIIDKFTAWNSDAAAITLTVWLVPSGGAHDNTNLMATVSVAPNASAELATMQNQVLGTGDTIFISASTANRLAVRVSGREVS
jgi:hypothetical protein